MRYCLALYLLMASWLEPPVLQLEIAGIKAIQGNIMVAVYDSGENFLSQKVITSGIFEVTGSTVQGILRLPYGTYGISVFHDQDSNGELNTNLFGIPKEPVGFSNNARGTFGPPDFEQTTFDFLEDRQTIKIKID